MRPCARRRAARADGRAPAQPPGRAGAGQEPPSTSSWPRIGAAPRPAGARRQRDAAIDAAGRRVEETVRDRADPGAAPRAGPGPAASSGRPRSRARPARRCSTASPSASPAETPGGVRERPVSRQIPVRHGHLAGRRRDRRSGRGAGGRNRTRRAAILYAQQRPGALAGVRIPVRDRRIARSRRAICPLTSWPRPNIVSCRSASRSRSRIRDARLSSRMPRRSVGHGPQMPVCG